MENNTQINYNKYMYFIKTFITRAGIDAFLQWLEQSDVCTAPASTQYHCAYEGGLVQHSLNVFNRLINLLNNEFGEDMPYSKDTIALVSLLHDVSKINFYEVKYRNVKNADGVWESVPFYSVRNDDNKMFFGNHAENSLYILTKFFKLTYEEELAILHHMGGLDFDDRSERTRPITAYKKSKLAFLLHLADMYATCIDEADTTITDANTIDINSYIPTNGSDEEQSTADQSTDVEAEVLDSE